jgi:hypothetical protein
VLGTVLLSVLAGHWRYVHITSVRCDPANPSLLGMNKVVSEDSVRRNLEKIDEAKGLAWLQAHLDYTTMPLLGEPWVLDMDSTLKPLYGHQEGAELGYNPHKPGRPSHCYTRCAIESGPNSLASRSGLAIRARFSRNRGIPYLHAVEPALGAAGRCAARQPTQRRLRDG